MSAGLPNAGRRSRTDYLANERTYLAYVRTALAFIAFGFLIARFSLFTREIATVAGINVHTGHTSTAFGVAMAVAGLITGGYGAYRYIATERGMLDGRDSPMPGWAATAGAVVTGLVALVVIAALFLVQ